MRVCNLLNDITAPFENAVVTIGNFDGVHLGHREIFRRLKLRARELNGTSVIVTFDPHPLTVVAPDRKPWLINTISEKITLIDASGVDILLIIPFDAVFASISANDFVEKILVGKIGLKHLIIGYDYAFGKGRKGDFSLLESIGQRLGYSVEELPPITDGSEIYSSSLIRRMILDGKVREVVHYLGRNFSVAGTVVKGCGRGKGLGFPTANIQTEKELIPSDGVYAVKVKLDDNYYDGACNIGSNPTFGTALKSVEVHIFDFDRDIYGQELRVYFMERLRSESRFSSIDELKVAIASDCDKCRQLLSGRTPVVYTEYLEGL